MDAYEKVRLIRNYHEAVLKWRQGTWPDDEEKKKLNGAAGFDHISACLDVMDDLIRTLGDITEEANQAIVMRALDPTSALISISSLARRAMQKAQSKPKKDG